MDAEPRNDNPPGKEYVQAHLKNVLGSDAVETAAEELIYYSQDYFSRGLEIDAVLKPKDIDELSRCMSLCADLSLAVHPRGGGYSYTSGYLAMRRGIVLDTSRMTRILEVNAQDHYVTVEAGCTWAKLDEALAPYGLRTPFWGPLSGLRATVGGGVSQGSISLGSSAYGVSSHSVLDMEIVLSGGRRIKTGASGQPGHPPFFRNYGPDLTGLFCSDCGAFGIKAHITLQLIKRPAHFQGVSFGFKSFEDCAEASARVALENVASDCLGMSAQRIEAEAARGSFKDNIRTLFAIGRSGGSLKDGAVRMAKVALGGKNFASAYQSTMHYVVEGASQALVNAKADILKQAVGDLGAQITNTVPLAIRASPFQEHMMLSASGQRQLPPSCILPFSKIVEFYEAFFKQLSEFQDRMELFNMSVSAVTATIGTSGFLFEPVIAWDDKADEFHVRHTPKDIIAKIAAQPAQQDARFLAAEIRSLMIDLAFKYGGVHLQIGKTYPFLRERDGQARDLLQAVKGFADPSGVLNPGALGMLEETDR